MTGMPPGNIARLKPTLAGLLVVTLSLFPSVSSQSQAPGQASILNSQTSKSQLEEGPLRDRNPFCVILHLRRGNKPSASSGWWPDICVKSLHVGASPCLSRSSLQPLPIFQSPSSSIYHSFSTTLV